MKVELTDCTPEELAAYVAAYPRPLERDVYGAYEPPLVTYNDWTINPKWPDSVVACYRDGYPEGSPPPYSGPPSGHKIARGAPGIAWKVSAAPVVSTTSQRIK